MSYSNNNNNNNIKMPKGYLLVFFLVFFGGMALSIGGTVADDSTVSTIGMVTLFGGTFIFIIITNAVLSAKRRKAAEERLKTIERQADGDADDADDDTADDEPVWEGTDDTTALLEGKLKVRDMSYVMDREDALNELLDKLYLGMLEDEFRTKSESYWDKYEGDDWDDNLEAIDRLIDEYYARTCALMGRTTAGENSDTTTANAETRAADEKVQAAQSLVGVLSAVADKAEVAGEQAQPQAHDEQPSAPAETAFAPSADHGTERLKRATVGYKGIKKK